ncbi:uncharacterized protein LOC123865484 [Maniola jurtina]|uniref:uncharacterized protein LOC123865484 n=1 Tax=Maniola jurtina TaxID=191418 RepID=UPI001E68A702|nr:uncharacterized protein LOC123865484 [Maniola jurtina]
MFIMKKLIFLTYFFRLCLCEPVNYLDGAKPLVEMKEAPVAFNNDRNNEILNPTLFITVKSYYCRARTYEHEELLLFGTKSWTFPPQSVNLTLRYPSENHQYADEVDYVLTGLRVVLHLSGQDAKGFITSGGMYQDHISMTFLFRNLTSLRYQLYLHGMPRNMLNRVTENYTAELDMC